MQKPEVENIPTDTPENIVPLETAESNPKPDAERERLLRALADAENRIKRAEREKDDGQKFAVSSFARDILNVADNLRRALDAIKPEDAAAHAGLKTLATGVEFTEKELLKALEKHGVKKIEPAIGDGFDYNKHQAMMELENPSLKPGTIAQVLQAGYAIHERLLRPALVGVVKAPKDSAQEKLDMQA